MNEWHKLYDCPICKSKTIIINMNKIIHYICTSCDFRFTENDIEELFGDKQCAFKT